MAGYGSGIIQRRQDKEHLLNQKALVIWLVGLSGSGKSTLASELERALHRRGFLSKILDGDEIRNGINVNLMFTKEDRDENVRRVAEIAKLFVNGGIIAICSLISPLESYRKNVKSIIGEEDYMEIYVKCPLSVCESRDVKGLYAKARNQEIKNFTGIDSPFEEPQTPSLVINTAEQEKEESLQILLSAVLERITVES